MQLKSRLTISGDFIKAAANFVVTLFWLDGAHAGNVIEGGLPLEEQTVH